MTNEAKTGIMLLCCVSGGPALAAGAFAWWLRGRVIAYGLPGAFLPRFLRDRL